MTQTITLTLPDRLYEPIQRIAQATDQPVEAVLLTALQTSLPSLEGLSDDLSQELIALEALDNADLQLVLLETIPREQQHIQEHLLQRSRTGALTETEGEQLSLLQKNADRIMLRKARAAVLLRFRGQRLPTLAELRRLTIDAQ